VTHTIEAIIPAPSTQLTLVGRHRLGTQFAIDDPLPQVWTLAGEAVAVTPGMLTDTLPALMG
jgi:hypothetical protein